MRRLRLPTGARGVPAAPWSARGSRWRARPITLLVLAVGLWLFGTGETALIEAGIGNSPWTVFAQGLADHLGVSIGAATFITSAVIILLWLPLRERPGLGTVANAVIIAVAIDTMIPILPNPHSHGPQLLQVLAGIATTGIGSGLYLTANLGPGPRDGLMTGLYRRFGIPVARGRLGIEAVAVSVGWALGGTVGLGTVLWALLIGYAVSLGLALVTSSSSSSTRTTSPGRS